MKKIERIGKCNKSVAAPAVQTEKKNKEKREPNLNATIRVEIAK